MSAASLHIGECSEHDAFLTNSEEWDVACLGRYTLGSHGVGCDEHVPQLLDDDQWQSLVNLVDAAPDLLAALQHCVEELEVNELARNMTGSEDTITQEAIKAAKAAIYKATGEAK